MKKIFTVFSVVLLCLLLSAIDLYAQAEFETGALGVRVSVYGRIRVYAPALDNVQQLERLTALVGTGSSTVFDYYNDWDTEESPVLVASPQISDFEIYGSYNNAYSGIAPNILAKNTVYGWTMGKYAIIKYVLINRETSSINAVNGLEVIPSPDDAYGAETGEYLAPANVVAYYRSGSTYSGFKYLDGDFSSLTTFDWYDGFNVDPDLWTWLNHGTIDTTFTSPGTDGIVSIPGQNAVPIASGDSVTLYVAYAVGADENELLANMDSAVAKFNQNFVTSIDDIEPSFPGSFELKQNFPNPFNPSTKINFVLAKDEKVSLKVFDILGKEITALVNDKLNAGEHSYEFSAKNLTSGIYYYTLMTPGQSATKKMVVLK